MKDVVLSDFEKWKKLNDINHFSFYDYIFHVLKSNKVNTDIYFVFFELFWPSFVVYKNYVFLKENYSIKKIDELIDDNKEVEFWGNLFLTDPYFENDENWEQKAELFAQLLLGLWEIKLKKDFPDRDFVVQCVFDKEDGDYGLTFFQIERGKNIEH